jgi:hypothetical protein
MNNTVIYAGPVRHFIDGYRPVELPGGVWYIYNWHISGQTIYQWNYETLDLLTVGELPYNYNDYQIITAFRSNENVTAVYGSENGMLVTAHDLSSNTSIILPELTETRNVDLLYAHGSSDGTHLYLFGRWISGVNSYILKYNVASHTVEKVPVVDYPDMDGDGIILSENLYVAKNNRLYFFGGLIHNATGPIYHDGIWYIDLQDASTEQTTRTTEESETTTSPLPDIPNINCSHRPDGFYPHPESCDLYISCRLGNNEVHTCPTGLLFDPVGRQCTVPENVNCELHCDGKEDGFYAHPYYCKFFTGCRSENFYVYECAEDLLFDFGKNICNFPELAVCLADL